MTPTHRRWTRWGNRLGVWLYRRTRGRLAGQSKDVHVLLLTSPGRRTGLPRSTCVRYLRRGDDLLIWGTGSGSPRDPDWFQNLRATDVVQVQVDASRFPARPRELHNNERDWVWEKVILAQAPQVRRYAAKAGRVIPVAVLTALPDTRGRHVPPDLPAARPMMAGPSPQVPMVSSGHPDASPFTAGARQTAPVEWTLRLAGFSAVVNGVGFGAFAVPGTWHLAREHTVWYAFGLPTYGNGPFEAHGIAVTVPLLVAFFGACLVLAIGGVLLLVPRSTGVVFTLAGIAMCAPFWWGFNLPFAWFSAIQIGVLLVMAWAMQRHAGVVSLGGRR